ncbi:hydroxyisourate hydrolase [Neptunomonas sp.]|uniref:hydroxyisourate hydrolase n=1 Tax=Neptunomonas sp. TaxID=1971898 RepID=UPI0025FA3448|nr:hydroxyisourate hydrolase [Neptunomonas sp.]
MGFLTTHVLDTAHGCPGNAIRVQLFRFRDNRRELLNEMITNADGRTDSAILPESEFLVGKYELVFAVGDYFKAKGVELADPAFIDDVSIHFGIADEGSHYHVPLLVSPYSYSTYRGS